MLDTIKAHANGEPAIHPDNVQRQAEAEEAARVQAELEQASHLTNEELEARGLLEQADIEEFEQETLANIKADLFDELAGEEYDVVVAAVNANQRLADQIIQEIEHGPQARGDRQDNQDDAGSVNEVATRAPLESGEDVVSQSPESSRPLGEEAKPISEVVSTSGEVQNKLFATPPTFGKKPNVGTAVGTSALLDNFTSEESVQPDMFGVENQTNSAIVEQGGSKDAQRNQVQPGVAEVQGRDGAETAGKYLKDAASHARGVHGTVRAFERQEHPEPGQVELAGEAKDVYAAVKSAEAAALRQIMQDTGEFPSAGFVVAWTEQGKKGETEHKVALAPDKTTIRKFGNSG